MIALQPCYTIASGLKVTDIYGSDDFMTFMYINRYEQQYMDTNTDRNYPAGSISNFEIQGFSVVIV